MLSRSARTSIAGARRDARDTSPADSRDLGAGFRAGGDRRAAPGVVGVVVRGLTGDASAASVRGPDTVSAAAPAAVGCRSFFTASAPPYARPAMTATTAVPRAT